MSFNYDKIAKLAQKKIDQFGQTITVTHVTQGAYNVATSTAAVTETTRTTRCVIDMYSIKEIDGNLVQVGDIKAILSAWGVTTPTINDKITLSDGTVYTVRAVDPLSPGGVPIIYTCQLRK